jgi:hypothetical protein
MRRWLQRTGRSSRSGDRHRDAAAPKHGAVYGTGALLAELDRQAISAMTKVAAPTPRGTSPSSSSASTWTPGGSPSRPAFSCRSSRPATVVGWPASAAPANCARGKLPAPAARLVGGSPSTPRRPGCRRPGSGSGSGLAGRLPHPPAHRGTQDQPLHPAAVGRTQSPLPRPGPHPHRRPHPSRRDQPRPPGHPRAPARAPRLGHRLTTRGTHQPARTSASAAPSQPSTPTTFTEHNPAEAPWARAARTHPPSGLRKGTTSAAS